MNKPHNLSRNAFDVKSDIASSFFLPYTCTVLLLMLRDRKHIISLLFETLFKTIGQNLLQNICNNYNEQ